MSRFTIHIEAVRGKHVSTTLCGMTFRVETAGALLKVTCQACKRAEKENRRAAKSRGRA